MKKSGNKIILFTAIIIVFCASFQPIIAGLNAEEKKVDSIDESTALLVACSKIKSLKQTTFKIISSNEIMDEQSNILGYVFNLQPNGYIVVPAFKNLPPILAYSFTDSFLKDGNILYDIIKADITLRFTYSSQISEEIIQENNNLWNSYLDYDNLILDDSSIYQWPKKDSTISGGWIETKWDQSSPYNDFCPIDLLTGKRSVAGCPAVTMAQILNYHQTTNYIQFNDSDDYYHSYSGNNFWIDDDYETYDFPSFPQLNSYLDNIELNYQNQEPITKEGKAALTFACGVAASQVYSSKGSGTFGVSQAYQAYKRFSFNTCQLLDDEPDLYEHVQENIMDGLPVHLAVVDEAWQTGHNLVIDGYKNDGFYHLNFGWGGPYDGWYKLPEELPLNLTVLEGVIVDIKNDYSNLKGEGALYWPNTKPADKLTGSFKIENVGLPGSEIDWKIIAYPSWGKWSFDPIEGYALTPGSGPLTINVSVDMPFRLKKNFNGYIKVVDTNDTTNSCLIHVFLSTKLSRASDFLIIQIFQKNFRLLPLLRLLF